MLTWLKEHISATPKEELIREWQEIEKLGFDGPNAVDYIKVVKDIYNISLKDCYPQQKVSYNIQKNETPECTGSHFFL